MFAIALACCAGCTVEKIVYVADTENAVATSVSYNCDARIVSLIGLSNNYFATNDYFKSGKISSRSAEVVLDNPLGPFNRATCSLTMRTPNVVDVTSNDRSIATNTSPCCFIDEITLKRAYGENVTAEELEKELANVVTLLNDAFCIQMLPPSLPIISDKKLSDTSKDGVVNRRALLRSRHVSEGVGPSMTVSVELKGQRVQVSAYEPIFCKRAGELKLKSPAKLIMCVYMNQWLNRSTDEESEIVMPITIGGDNTKSFFGAFSQAQMFERNQTRQIAQYEYNINSQLITRTPEHGFAPLGSLRQHRIAQEAARTREQEREEQRKQLREIQEELKKARQARADNDSITNKVSSTGRRGMSRSINEEEDSCAIEAIRRFEVWLKDHPYNKAAHKIDLKKICGRDFGEPSEFLGTNVVTTGGSGGEVLTPFPPFKKMHRLYGAQPGHPMDWCHFGRYPKVGTNDLVVVGDYANEARLLKEKFEKMFGIVMSERKRGKGFEYDDEYNRIVITLDAESTQGSTVHHYPLVVDIYDKELDRQNDWINDVYRGLKHTARCNALLKNPREIPNPPKGNSADEFESVLPIKSYGIFTVGKLPNFEAKVNWVKKSFNAEYIDTVDDVPFRIWICRSGDAISSIEVEPVNEFGNKDQAERFYRKFKKMIDDAGVKGHTGLTAGTKGNMSYYPNHYSWTSPTDPNVEMSVDMQERNGKWRVYLFLKDLGHSSGKKQK